MTIQELYSWALSEHAEDYNIAIEELFPLVGKYIQRISVYSEHATQTVYLEDRSEQGAVHVLYGN